MSNFVITKNTSSYREATHATDPIETPAVGFAKPSDYQAATSALSAIIKQNNTQIQLLVQIFEKLEDIQSSLTEDLICKLQNLSLGKADKPKEKVGKLRVSQDPYTLLMQEQEKLKK